MAAQVKSDQTKKMDVVKEIHQLKIKAHTLEREKCTQMYNRHSEFSKEFGPFQEMEMKMTADRKTEKAKWQQELNKIKNMVKKFHRELKDVKPTPEFVEKLKIIMEDIEGHISTFKNQQRLQYEDLMKEERVSNQEVVALEKRIEAWSQQGPASERSHQTTVPLPSHRDVTRNLPPEVTAFERFMQQTGGPRGGWDEYDHGTFLKFRNRHKGKPGFISELITALPTKTDEEIRQHETWFQEYNILNETKKQAIQRWRELKEEEKDDILTKAENSDSEEEKKIHEERRMKIMERERQERKQYLNKWKVEKELAKAEGEERRLKQELEKAKKVEREKQRQLDVKKQVVEYKQVKDELQVQKQLQEAYQEYNEMECRKKQAEKNIVRFQQRDKETIEKKLAKEKARAEDEEERRRKLERLKEQVPVSVERDPSRLLRPTEGWKERQKDTDRSEAGRVLHMPHRAVPGWRQGMH